MPAPMGIAGMPAIAKRIHREDLAHPRPPATHGNGCNPPPLPKNGMRGKINMRRHMYTGSGDK
jgi:hypothetical protein